ncbi:hypothetical protein GCM10027447_12450 [Glycomyces halotolerans]
MTKYTVTTPVKGFSGARAGVMFHRGVGEVDDSDQSGAKSLAYFKRKGYGIEPVGEADSGDFHRGPVDEQGGEDLPRPTQSSSKADWAVWVGTVYADEVDPEQAADMTKAQLMAYVREREGGSEDEGPAPEPPEGDEE